MELCVAGTMDQGMPSERGADFRDVPLRARCISPGVTGSNQSVMSLSGLGNICGENSGVIPFAGQGMLLKLSHFPWKSFLPCI